MPQMKPFRGIMLNNSHPLARGLVALWLFNEVVGNKVFDLSGNRKIGTLTLGPYFTPGKFGSSVFFDNTDDYIDCGDIDLQGAMTVSAWVNTPALGSNSDIVSNLTLGPPENMQYLFRIGEQGPLQFQWNNTGTTEFWFTSNGIISINTWYHVVVVRDAATNVKIYLNGVEQGITQGGSQAVPATHGNTQIGKTATFGGSTFNGLIDHVIVWNRALSASEIAWLYREPFSIFEKVRIPFFIPVVPPVSPNFTDRNNYNGYTAFIQQYIKHKVNGTDPWANPDGTLL